MYLKKNLKNVWFVKTRWSQISATFEWEWKKKQYINKSGLCELIFFSNLPNAKKFKDWVFEEVLPSLRKTGKYEIYQQKKAEAEQEDYKEVVTTEVKKMESKFMFKIGKWIWLTYCYFKTYLRQLSRFTN